MVDLKITKQQEQDEVEFEEWHQIAHPEPYYQYSRPDQLLTHDFWKTNKQYRKEGWLASRRILREKEGKAEWEK